MCHGNTATSGVGQTSYLQKLNKCVLASSNDRGTEMLSKVFMLSGISDLVCSFPWRIHDEIRQYIKALITSVLL